VSEREEEPHPDGRCRLHELAVSCRWPRCVGIDGVAEAERVGEEGGREHDRVGGRRREGEPPCDDLKSAKRDRHDNAVRKRSTYRSGGGAPSASGSPWIRRERGESLAEMARYCIVSHLERDVLVQTSSVRSRSSHGCTSGLDHGQRPPAVLADLGARAELHQRGMRWTPNVVSSSRSSWARMGT